MTRETMLPGGILVADDTLREEEHAGDDGGDEHEDEHVGDTVQVLLHDRRSLLRRVERRGSGIGETASLPRMHQDERSHPDQGNQPNHEDTDVNRTHLETNPFFFLLPTPLGGAFHDGSAYCYV